MIAWYQTGTRQLDQAHDYIALSNSRRPRLGSPPKLSAACNNWKHSQCRRPGRTPAYREFDHLEYSLYRAYTIVEHSIVILAGYHGAGMARRLWR